jgi:hypothetical protein
LGKIEKATKVQTMKIASIKNFFQEVAGVGLNQTTAQHAPAIQEKGVNLTFCVLAYLSMM